MKKSRKIMKWLGIVCYGVDSDRPIDRSVLRNQADARRIRNCRSLGTSNASVNGNANGNTNCYIANRGSCGGQWTRTACLYLPLGADNNDRVRTGELYVFRAEGSSYCSEFITIIILRSGCRTINKF